MKMLNKHWDVDQNTLFNTFIIANKYLIVVASSESKQYCY